MGRCSPRAGPGLLTELVVPSAAGPVHTAFQAHITWLRSPLPKLLRGPGSGGGRQPPAFDGWGHEVPLETGCMGVGGIWSCFCNQLLLRVRFVLNARDFTESGSELSGEAGVTPGGEEVECLARWSHRQ